ncbi:MAG: right-handed parallel beta-helix repeat-containing protein [Edaphobacter sp.]
MVTLLWKHPKSVICAIFMAAICQPAFASFSCVNPGGTKGCFNSITAAVAAAHPGGTINVEPGTYKENVVINIPLSLIGAGPNKTIIDATGLSNAIYIDGLDNPGLHSVTVSGFTLENANFEGLLVTNASYITLNKNTVLDNNNSLDVEAGTCPGIPDFEPGEQMDCGEGIHIMGVAYSTISNNTSANNSGGILISDDTGETHDNLITGNYVHDNGFACGIVLASHQPAIGSTAPHHGIVHNTISNNRSIHNGAAIPAAGAGVGIFSNGTGLGTNTGNIIINNVLKDNGLPGVTFHTHVGPNFGLPADNLNNNSVIGNTISGNAADTGDTATPGPAGININSGMGGTPITGTVIWGNSINDEAVDVAINTPAKVEVQYNNLLDKAIGVANLGSGSVNATQNYWGCFNGPGAKGCSTISGPSVSYFPFLRIPFFSF